MERSLERSLSMKLRAGQQQLPNLSIDLNIAQYQRAEASAEMRAAAEGFEQRFSIEFSTLTHFPKASLSSLHHSALCELELPAGVRVASREDPSIVAEIQIMTKIANAIQISVEDRRQYWDALKRIYAKLPRNPDYDREDPNTLFV